MAVHVRLLGPSDSAVLDNVADDVFDHAIDTRWTREFFADDRHHIVVALDGDLVVGFASAVHHVHPDKPPALYITEVGVAPSHQRRGIGKEIMAAMLAHGRSLGCREAWIGTEENNLPARRLYGAAGGREEEDRAVTFTFQLDDDASR